MIDNSAVLSYVTVRVALENYYTLTELYWMDKRLKLYKSGKLLFSN